MAKQLNVALDFTANTTQAKQSIQELQQLLTKLSYSTDLGLKPEQMQKASEAARQLAFHLNEAYNTATGNYDLSKLNASLNRSQTNVTKLSKSLLDAGVTGQQAFVKLAQSIAAADQPMISLNARLQDFLTTVKNTVKWQISSSMIHSVMGALQGAYGYAQDLNRSLNDIRIVTGHNIDYMDKFADKANKAAKALSTSTLNYTDASLIYYQQGLSDKEVEDRTAVTIKMANAAGESADKISQQLTAVWNNFYDGSQSLEYYADVMTALGAATASSTDEIAAGLEKFAAVSNTVGLSYEYATSALATVTATTRQSADVVGTAFKTLFARIQDLELGKTLEDGTTLGKYSQALEAVGVSIKTADGGLREMDDILDDLGEKWNSFDAEGNPLISKDAKVALAQTVAGVRQYTQLIALMDKWDFMKENLETARNATGTLTEQQKIYEESWEAANKRLKASFQGLYQDLIDDKFFIKLTDFLADTVDGVDSFIDKIGGLKPVLIGILAIVEQSLASKIEPALRNVISNIQILVGGADKAYAKIHTQINEQTSNYLSKKGDNLDEESKQSLLNSKRVSEMKDKIAIASERMTAAEKSFWETEKQGIQQQGDQLIKLGQEIDAYTKIINDAQDTMIGDKKGISKAYNNQMEEVWDQASYHNNPGNAKDALLGRKYEQLYSDLEGYYNKIDTLNDNLVNNILSAWLKADGTTPVANLFNEMTTEVTAQLDKLTNLTSENYANVVNIKDPIPTQDFEIATAKAEAYFNLFRENLPKNIQDLGILQSLEKEIASIPWDETGTDKRMAKMRQYIQIVQSSKLSQDQLVASLRGMGVGDDEVKKVVQSFEKMQKAQEKAKQKQEELNKQVENFKPKHLVGGIEAFMSMASFAQSAGMAISSINSLISSIKDPDMSGWEKAVAILTSIGSLSFMVKSGIDSLATGIQFLKQVRDQHNASILTEKAITEGLEIAKLKETAATYLESTANKINNETISDSTKKKTLNALQTNLMKLGLNKETAAKITNTLATKGLTAATQELNIALKGVQVSLLPLIAKFILIAAIIAAVGFAIYTLVKRSQSFNTELKQSNEDLQILQSNLDNVNSEVQKVTSSLDGLSSKYDAFKDLKYGTTEWREALYDVNNEVQDLIDNYNKMADADSQLKKGEDWYYDVNNIQHLTESGWNKIKQQALDKQNKAQTAVNSQNNRDEQLQLEAKTREISKKNENIVVGTKREKYQFRPNEYRYHTVNATDTLTTSEINKVVKAAMKDSSFDFSKEDLINKAGLDENTAKLITSNRETREALEKLTAETSRLADSYQNDVLNELLSRGLDLSGYDEKYRNGIGELISQDVIDYENKIIASRGSNSGNELTESEILNLLSQQGYSVNELGDNWLQDFTSGNTTIPVKLTDENGGTVENSEVTFDYDTILKNFAAEQSRQWGLSQQDNYFDEQIYSQKAFDAASRLKPSWDEQNFDEDKIQEQASALENMGQGSALPSEIGKLQEFLTSNSESFADIFGMSEDDFKAWAGDANNLTENFGKLQQAVEGDSGAINELRDEMGSLGTHGQELVDELAGSWDKCNDKVKAFSDWMNDSTSLTKKYNAENEAAFDEFVAQNSDALSDLAGVSKDTFEKLYKEDKRYARKVAKLMPDVAKGNQKALAELNIATQRSFYTTGEQVNQVLQNIANSGRDDLKAAFGDSLSSVQSEINTCFTQIQEAANGLQLDPKFDTTEAIASLNTLISAFGFTAEQAQAFVASMGFDAEIESKPTPVTSHEEAVVYTSNIDEHGHHLDPPSVVPIDTTTMVNVPTVKTLDWSGKEYGGKTTDLTTNPTATNNNGGGGNGGGGSSYTPPPPKEYKDEIERYHVIKQKIEDLEEVMEHLAKAKERAFGTSKLELMDQEIEKYDEMIDLQNQYLDEINKYWDEDKALIASYGAEFDETGVITNYDEIMKRQIDKYNSSIGKNEDADNAAEEAYDDFIEALEQYEETNNLRQDELEKLYDLQTELADVIFEKTQYKIEIKIAVKDDELEYLDYLLSKIEDNAYSAAEAIALIGEKTENALEKTKTYSDGLLELLNNHGINSIEELDKLTVDDLKAKNFTEDEIDQIRKWRSSILEANQELLEMRATIQEKVLDSFNQFSEDIQDQIDLFEHYQNILEGVKDITSLLGAQLNEQSKLVLRNLNRSLMNNSINNLAGAKQQVETLKQMRAKAQEQYDKAIANGDSIGIKQWSDSLKEIDEQVHSAEENFLDTWQEALERARDIFEEEMDNIVKEFEEGISPIYGSIEALQDAITRANELNDQYLNDADKTYELNKLRRQIEGSIDDTDIIPHKQALNKLQDELNKKLKDGSKISEYDLKILQSKYELELARQKLEDVQNSNETVRLTRDNNGNWGYVYSANEDKIAEAEQEYEDKLNAYQKANEEYLKTLENNILQLQSDYQEKLTAIKLSFTQGEISQAEYEKQVADLEKYYDERMQQIHQQYEEVFKNSKDANEKFVTYYKDSSGALVENFNQTTLALKTGYSTLDEMFNAFWKSHDNYGADSNKLLDDYLNKIKEINSTAGIEGSFADAASRWSIKITGESDKAVADMGKIVKNATESFNDVIKAASDWESIYVPKIDIAIKRNEALVKTMNEMVAALSGMNSIDYSKYENAIDSRSTATANNIISTQHNSESFNKTVEVPDYISQFSYLDMLDQLDMNKQIEDWMSNNELNIDTALMDSLDISTILQNIGLNVQTIVSYLSNLIPSSLGVDRIAQEFMQQVSINADFPNVTDSNEIMEAFEMMENEASQYASRKTV